LGVGASTLTLLAASSGCGDPFGQKAQFANAVDTVTLFALRGTPIRAHSAYDMYTLSTSRTDTTSGYDFAFDLDSTGAARVYPGGALGLAKDAGLQLMDRTFDAVSSAPETGFATDTSIVVAKGDVFVARSRTSSLYCVYVAVPRYGKFHVIDIDTTARSITMEGLVDLNCGYRGLDPGLPGS
jgi:hypothetical protein